MKDRHNGGNSLHTFIDSVNTQESFRIFFIGKLLSILFALIRTNCDIISVNLACHEQNYTSSLRHGLYKPFILCI